MEAHSFRQKLKPSDDIETYMRRMVNSPFFSDVVLLCNDGNMVQAHKMVLAGGSKVFDRMLSNDMTESNRSEIELPTFSSTTVLTVLEFLYTRTTPVDYCPQNWTMACEVMVAADFFDIPKLKVVVSMFCEEQVCGCVDKPAKLATLLTKTLEVTGLNDDDRDTLLREVVKILSLFSPSLHHIPRLSEVAFNYLLVNSKVSYDGSPREYLCFRQVMYWWACKSDLEHRPRKHLKDLMISVLPNLTNAKRLCENQANHIREKSEIEVATSRVSILSNEWNSCLLDVEPRSSTIRLLSNINYLSIHPVLLSQVIEPLEMISSETIQNSFRSAKYCQIIPSRWDYDDSFKIFPENCVVGRATKQVGLAILETPFKLLCREPQYAWGFQVEELCEDFTELGLYYYSSGQHGKRLKSDGKSLSHQDCAKVLHFQGSQAYVNIEGRDGHMEWKLLKYDRNYGGNIKAKIVVKFLYDASKQICSLSLNGKVFDSLWSNLPNRLCYPAISFGSSLKGRVSGMKCPFTRTSSSTTHKAS